MSTTKTYIISSIEDINKLRNQYNTYAHIIIDSKKIKYKGVFRYALKYAFHALILEGELNIIDDPHTSFTFEKGKMKFWQIRLETFNVLSDYTQTIYLNDNEGIIKLKKTYEYPEPTGISFGIVFSGHKEDEVMLNEVLISISKIENLQSTPYEVIICGPSDFNVKTLKQRFEKLVIRYLFFDIPQNEFRIPICKKKNFIYLHSTYSTLVISHTRITFPVNFLNILNVKFDFITPKVVYIKDNIEYRYLDFLLIGSYDDLYRSPTFIKIFAGCWVNNDYLYLLKNAAPSIDGGINIFNKNILKEQPYNVKIAWGEAEDVVLSQKLNYLGYLIDYYPFIRCISLTDKVNVSKENIFLNLLKYKVYVPLLRKLISI